MAERIRIEDLANPVLTDMQRAALDCGESQHVDLTIEAVLGAAVAATGLDDFGPEDFHELLQRRFPADRPNELWVSDFTHVATWSGFVHTAFVTDVCSRRIVGWRTATSTTTAPVMDALNMAVHSDACS
jgi:transposase InsO family protein